MAFEAGAAGVNLTESQYGLASLKFRWNLSGTYQQVIPRYLSTDKSGRDEREFLNDYFPDMGKLATAIFLKGYQWPFDPRKVSGHGSSLIDILVYQETIIKGRRVFLDFKHNPGGAGKLEDFSFKLLSPEAFAYLEKSGALLATPIERLRRMNQPAIDIYEKHGIDLAKENLEIAVCAQHNNGGIKGDIWWESNIRHLFPVGEANGTHGVYRPGGSALNSGQVGSIRAALFIAKRYGGKPLNVKNFLDAAESQVREKFAFAKNMISEKETTSSGQGKARREFQGRMSASGAHIRDPNQIGLEASKAWRMYARLKKGIRLVSVRELPDAFKDLDLCLTHAVYLEAIKEYIEKGGRSRGSYLVLDPGGEKPCPQLDEGWRFSLEKPDSFMSRKILEIRLDEEMRPIKQWVDIRPIPAGEGWFENVWDDFRKDKIVR
jgi:succinate dehydrogenase/fumarate reductase flavoprotein subunit